MAKDTIEFALSEETEGNLQEAVKQMKDYTDDGWNIADIRIETRQQGGVKIKVGVIEVKK